MPWTRRRFRLVASGAMAAVMGLSAVPARAQPTDSEPATTVPPAAVSVEPTNERAVCLAAHESAQLARIEGRLLEARERLLSCAREVCPGPIQADCAGWLKDVVAALPSVILVVTSERGDEPAASASIDGEPVFQTGRALLLNPGVHRLRVELAPFAPIEQTLLVRQGEHERRVAVHFLTPPEPALTTPGSRAATPPADAKATAPSGARPVPWFTYTLAAVSLVGVGGTVYFGASALAEREDQLASCAPLCAEEQTRQVTEPALLADVSLVVAVMAGLGAGYTYLSRPSVQSAQRAPLRLRMVAGRRAAFASWRSTF